MKLVDANGLLYAVNRDAEHHEVSGRWLDDFSRFEGITWEQPAA